jgi:hypothetical protein
MVFFSNDPNLADSERVRVIDSLDMGPVIFKLASELGPMADMEEIETDVRDYRKFWFLCHKYPKMTLVPTKGIDRVWHAHILDTKKYAEDCQVVFGYFLHHFPYFGMGNDRAEYAGASADTKLAFEREFGIIPAELGFHSLSFCDGGPPCGDNINQIRPGEGIDTRMSRLAAN